MPKNPGLKLFIKTWPRKSEKKGEEEERKRPLTATLEKPTILDIRYMSKIDMSIIRKEFLNITNLCRLPLVIKSKGNAYKQLSILNADIYKTTKKKRKKAEPSDDSHEDEESSVIQSAKLQAPANALMRSRSSRSSNKSVINRVKQNSILAIKNSINDANNNKTLKVPSRKPNLTTIRMVKRMPSPDLGKSSTKLPSPCKTCGRPDLPERFHSHPATPLKLSPKKSPGKRAVGATKSPEKIPVKSTVQKPIAIKYKSKGTSNMPSDTRKTQSPLKKSTSSGLPIPKVCVTSPVKSKETPSSNKENSMGKKTSTTPLRGGSGKRTLTCYICGREFGTASLPLHEPKCIQKWKRENANLPPNLRRKLPIKPEGNISQKEWNQLAWEASQAALVPCGNCGRTFLPDRLVVHQRSCKAPLNHPKKSSSNDTLYSSSSSPMSLNSDRALASTPSKPQQPPSLECYICGKMFGTHSIKIHERQCLKKWHVENESLPYDMRSPAPLRPAKSVSQKSLVHTSPEPIEHSTRASPKSDKDDRPASGPRSHMLPCYLCGRLFSISSIYIHEPQCLKKWKIENDKLPPNKQRSVPLKPDIKFTHNGKINFEEINDAYWQTHLSQLVPCKICSRTFNPDRVAVHERSCKRN
ncbi:zinc finger protein 474-like isoform X1 [Euwallacea similis]|uniref:zinc finger protein 474-like isoform X1 n=1 Tax=Euwallacea similis TaxID=1736056 RepID=UPI00344D538C